jgi:predicted nucleic acid-binding protein
VILLDTNVLSALMYAMPDQRVVDWLDRQARTSVWTTSITVMEVQFGLQLLPQAKRQASLTNSFKVLLDRMEHRVVPFDAVAAQQAGDLMAARQRKGRPVDLRDTMIAGVALAHHATHFEDTSIPLVNPWTA